MSHFQMFFQVGQSLYTKGNLLLCKRDYLRLFGSTGYCAACRKVERDLSYKIKFLAFN